MKKLTAIFLTIMALAVAGCNSTTHEKQNNPYRIKKLFTVEGCTVYSYWVLGNLRTMNTCNSQQGEQSWN